MSELPPGWVEARLGSAMIPIEKTKVEKPQDIELLTVKLHAKGLERSGKYPNETEKSRPYYQRGFGEILIGRQNFHNGGVGIVDEWTNGLIASNAISSFKPTDCCDVDYLLFLLTWEGFYKKVENFCNGTGQKEISEAEISKLKIILPRDVGEQREVARIISQIDRLITFRSVHIEKLIFLKTATIRAELEKIYSAPTNRKIKMGSLIVDGPTNGYSPQESPEFKSVLMFNLGAVSEHGMRLNEVKFAPEDSKVLNFLVNEGDFLMTRSNTREKVGLAAIVPRLSAKYSYPDLMMRIKFDDTVNERFLAYYMNFGPLRKVIMQSAQGTSETMVKLNSTIVKNLELIIPNRNTQDKLCEQFEAFQKLIEFQKLRLELLQNLKRGICNDLLTGRVRVKV